MQAVRLEPMSFEEVSQFIYFQNYKSGNMPISKKFWEELIAHENTSWSTQSASFLAMIKFGIQTKMWSHESPFNFGLFFLILKQIRVGIWNYQAFCATVHLYII
jgi:hypothetical protein